MAGTGASVGAIAVEVPDAGGDVAAISPKHNDATIQNLKLNNIKVDCFQLSRYLRVDKLFALPADFPFATIRGALSAL